MSESPLLVRPVAQRDRDAWLQMRCALWPGDEDGHAADIDRYLIEPFPGLLSALVAEAEDVLLGFAELSIRPCAEGCLTTRVAYLEGWYVVPEAQRRGIGRLLVRGAEDWARAQGCTEFASDAELENEQSRLAHLGCGFEEVGLVRCFRKVLSTNKKGGMDT